MSGERRARPVVAVLLSLLILIIALVAAPLVSRASGLPLERIFDLNFPRAVLAAFAGAALAVSGVVLQAVLRNPLATPYTLGISSGAALFAATAIKLESALATVPALLGLAGVESAALAGALASAGLVYAIARRRDDLPAETLLLAGVAVALLSASGIAVVEYLAATPDLFAIVRWSMGGIAGATWRDLLGISPLLLLGAAVLVFVVRDLDVAALDEESARALGVDPVRARRLAFLGASLLTAGVVAVAGPVGFVGLIVPHAVRRLAGPDSRVVLPCSALAGAAFLVLCDTVARTALYPTELPINIVTSAVGCPTFIWILARRR